VTTEAEQQWMSLDASWHEAFRQAWDAFRTGNIAVGACVSAVDGTVVASSRNRVGDTTGPLGQMFGTSVAHAELNALARLPFRHPRELVLTTTLQPCLQCSAAIRMAPIATVRVAGADPLWDGCGDFSSLGPWLARRPPVPIDGPRTDEVGVFGVFISRFGLGLIAVVEEALRARGDGPLIDLVRSLETSGEVADLARMDVEAAFVQLWPQLNGLRESLSQI
jgi:tRNA(Arg) A34 adenosine deaminase TadA